MQVMKNVAILMPRKKWLNDWQYILFIPQTLNQSALRCLTSQIKLKLSHHDVHIKCKKIYGKTWFISLISNLFPEVQSEILCLCLFHGSEDGMEMWSWFICVWALREFIYRDKWEWSTMKIEATQWLGKAGRPCSDLAAVIETWTPSTRTKMYKMESMHKVSWWYSWSVPQIMLGHHLLYTLPILHY